ncbi:MAG: hypothetical protein ACRCXB_27910 [Aeromonadaceae bacterium]
MAEKPTPVSVEARRLDISILPTNFSLPLTDFLVNQSDDLANVAGQANTAADDAYFANLTNEEQDVVLSEHSETLLKHDARISSVELVTQDHEVRIAHIEGDYVSKSETAPQSLSSPLNVAISYSVNGVKVVGERQTGWVEAGGDVVANIGAWNPNTLAPASAAYSQSEASEVISKLNAAEARLKALESVLRTHGLID